MEEVDLGDPTIAMTPCSFPPPRSLVHSRETTMMVIDTAVCTLHQSKGHEVSRLPCLFASAGRVAEARRQVSPGLAVKVARSSNQGPHVPSTGT